MKNNFSYLPNKFEHTMGGGFLSVFGLPFFIAGLFMLLTYFKIIDIGEVTGDRIVLLILGAIFTLVGSLLVFGRLKIVVDNSTKKVLKTFSVIMPIKKFEYTLTDFNLVTVTREVRRSGNSTTIVFPVRLKNKEGLDLNIAENKNYNKSRIIAEKIAKLILFDIEDSSSGSPILRLNEHLDESLRERQQRTDIEIDTPTMPQSLFEKITDRGSDIEIKLPKSKGLLLKILIPLLSMLAFYGIAFSFFAGNSDDFTKDFGNMPLYFIIIFCLIFFSPIILIIVGAFLSGKTARLIKVSPISLKIFSGRKEIEILSDKLEELIIEGMEKKNNFSSFFSTNNITAISDKTSISFGQGLNIEELNYVYAVIFNKITE